MCQRQNAVECINLRLEASVYDNETYPSHSKNFSNISEIKDNTDTLAQYNYMALWSNTMPEEDLVKASKDGFDSNNIDKVETVIFLDKTGYVLLG